MTESPACAVCFTPPQLSDSIMSPTTLLLLQLIVVLVVARACSWIANRLGQPGVVGEMAAGVVLGPIVLGALAPKAHAAIFSAGSLAGLSALSTFGLVLFMFVIGLELRWPDGVRAQIRAATSVGVVALLAFLFCAGLPRDDRLLRSPVQRVEPISMVG